jgi:hypothetical protein
MIHILFIVMGYILIKSILFLILKPINYYKQFISLSFKDKIINYYAINLLFHNNF